MVLQFVETRCVSYQIIISCILKDDASMYIFIATFARIEYYLFCAILKQQKKFVYGESAIVSWFARFKQISRVTQQILNC